MAIDDEVKEQVYRQLPGRECPNYYVRIEEESYLLLCPQSCEEEPCQLERHVKGLSDMYLSRRDGPLFDDAT